MTGWRDSWVGVLPDHGADRTAPGLANLATTVTGLDDWPTETTESFRSWPNWQGNTGDLITDL